MSTPGGLTGQTDQVFTGVQWRRARRYESARPVARPGCETRRNGSRIPQRRHCDREVMVAAFGATGVLYRMRHRALRSPLQHLYRCLLLAALCFTSLVVPAVRAQDRELDIDVVYQALEPYGRWFEHAVWGTVWQPTVEPG